jgi:hypothetical protein
MDSNVWIIDEVADKLCTDLGLTIGYNFFIGELPEPGIDGQTIQDALYIVEMPGPPPDQYLDTETHLFDLWASSSDTKSASVLLVKAYNMLHRAANYTLVNWYVYFSYVSSTIHDDSRGREGNKKLSMGITVICRNLNNLS